MIASPGFPACRKFGIGTSATIALTVLLGAVAPVQAEFTTRDAMTTLQIYSNGGEDLVSEVSLDVLSDLSAVSAYCMAAGPATLQQKLAIVRGILAATEHAAGGTGRMSNMAQQCCPLFTAVSVDARITYGAELALEARRAFHSDQPVAGRMKTLVSACADDVLDRSFTLALGNDRIGLFIARDDAEGGAQYQTASGTATVRTD